MKNLLLILFVAAVIAGCENNSEPKAPSENERGEMVCLDSLSDDGYANKYCRIFYPSGELMTECFLKDDSIKNGTQIYYYKNGNVEDSMYYAGGFIHGIRVEYYVNGNMKRKNQYAAVKDFSYRNMSIEYDSITGELDEENSFYFTYEIQETNDSVIVNFNFDLPAYRDTAFIEVSDFDVFFRPTKDMKRTYIPVIDNKAVFAVKKNDNDTTYIRAIIHNYDFDNSDKERLFYLWDNVKH